MYACVLPLSAQSIPVQLEVEGQLQMKQGAAEGYLLQSDATGKSTWVKPAYIERKEIDVTDFGAIADFSTDNTSVMCLPINYKCQAAWS